MLSGHSFGNIDFHMMLSSQFEQKMSARDILTPHPTPHPPTPHSKQTNNVNKKQKQQQRLKR